MTYAPPQRRTEPRDARRALQRDRAEGGGGQSRPGPSGAAQSRLQAALDASPRVVRQSRQADSLSTARISRAPAPDGGTIQRVVYPTMDALLTAALGGPAPDLTGFAPELLAFFQDAEDQLPDVDVVANPGLGRVAEITTVTGAAQPYRLEYDPNEPDQENLVASILHELIHASTHQNYDRGGAVGLPAWLNLNLPPGLVGPAVGAEVDAQEQVLAQNLLDLDHIVARDNTLSGHMRGFLAERVQYAYVSPPQIHYDTVIADMLAYLELNGYHSGPTYDFLRRLAAEANDRRLVDPYWGVKRARRVERNARWYQGWKW
jgi:hypothetical protein